MSTASIRGRLSLSDVVERLERAYGRPRPPATTDPWEMILRVNVVYLADDEDRERAFEALRKNVGLRPDDILRASKKALVRVASLAGILPETSAKKLRQSAEIAATEFGGDVRQVLDWPVDRAKKALKRFPGIGDPGAEKILLFAGRSPTLALDSNGLRVLVRLGFAADTGRYAATYRNAQASALESSPRDGPWLVEAHEALRMHGQRTCRRSAPLCDACDLRDVCPYPHVRRPVSRGRKGLIR